MSTQGNAREIRHGIKDNLPQFTLLVLINALVGGMLGMERTILPELAQQEFGIVAKSALLSFIIAFGVVKAFANLFTGKLAAKYGRKRLLVFGWVWSLPVPFMLIYAPSWEWVIAANILLGAHQGFAWSATVLMKIDIAGDKDRGLAMGLNEFAGYLAVGLMAFVTWAKFGMRCRTGHPTFLRWLQGAKAT